MDKEVAFITGATSGIGAAFACHFAREGYDLIITGHPDDKISPCVEELQEK
jgi:short-subunit dehydrogenase